MEDKRMWDVTLPDLSFNDLTLDLNLNSSMDLTTWGSLGTNSPALTTNPQIYESQSNFSNTVLLVANMIIVVFIFTGNIITIYLMATNKSLRAQNTNCFAVSLSCADLLIGAIYPFFSVLNYTHSVQHLLAMHYPCAICLYCIMVSAGISQFTLLVISIERYIAVMHPLQYSHYVQKSKVYLAIGVIWSYATLACLTMFVVLEDDQGYDIPCSLLNQLPLWYYMGIILPHIFIPKVISFVLYGRILHIANKQAKQIQDELVQARTRVASRREKKAAKMTAILLGLFLVCWMPYLVVYIIAYIMGPNVTSVMFDLLEFSKILSLSNSYMNPMVYFWKNKDFREALTHLLRCRKEIRRKDSDSESRGLSGSGAPYILPVHHKPSVTSVTHSHC